MKGKIDKLIINAPYKEPKQYWEYIRETRGFMLQEGCRSAGRESKGVGRVNILYIVE